MFIFATLTEYLDHAINSIKEVAAVFFQTDNCQLVDDKEFIITDKLIVVTIEMQTDLEVVKFQCATTTDAAKEIIPLMVENMASQNERELIKDFVGEVANTLVGCIQKKISASDITLTFGLPEAQVGVCSDFYFSTLYQQYIEINGLLFLVSVDRQILIL